MYNCYVYCVVVLFVAQYYGVAGRCSQSEAVVLMFYRLLCLDTVATISTTLRPGDRRIPNNRIPHFNRSYSSTLVPGGSPA